MNSSFQTPREKSEEELELERQIERDLANYQLEDDYQPVSHRDDISEIGGYNKNRDFEDELNGSLTLESEAFKELRSA